MKASKTRQRCRTWRTGARVAVRSFLASAAVLAREGQAICRNGAAVAAVRTRKSLGTLTEVRVDQVHALCTCRRETQEMSHGPEGPRRTVGGAGDAPFRQGSEEQWSIFFSQLKPA